MGDAQSAVPITKCQSCRHHTFPLDRCLYLASFPVECVWQCHLDDLSVPSHSNISSIATDQNRKSKYPQFTWLAWVCTDASWSYWLVYLLAYLHLIDTWLRKMWKDTLFPLSSLKILITDYTHSIAFYVAFVALVCDHHCLWPSLSILWPSLSMSTLWPSLSWFVAVTAVAAIIDCGHHCIGPGHVMWLYQPQFYFWSWQPSR